MAEKRIEIVEDVNDIVTYDEIVRDTVSRADVDTAKARIEVLKQEIAVRNDEIAVRNVEIEKLEEQIAKAEHIIALADEKRAREVAEQEVATEPVAE